MSSDILVEVRAQGSVGEPGLSGDRAYRGGVPAIPNDRSPRCLVEATRRS
jgi:hypothetical protein